MAETQVHSGKRVIQSLVAATAVGAGGSYDLSGCYSKFTLQTVVSGAPTTVSVVLEGSLDGTNWTTLATSSSTTGDQQSVADKPQAYVRARVATLTGGTSPAVSAFIAACA